MAPCPPCPAGPGCRCPTVPVSPSPSLPISPCPASSGPPYPSVLLSPCPSVLLSSGPRVPLSRHSLFWSHWWCWRQPAAPTAPTGTTLEWAPRPQTVPLSPLWARLRVPKPGQTQCPQSSPMAPHRHLCPFPRSGVTSTPGPAPHPQMETGPVQWFPNQGLTGPQISPMSLL